MEFQSKKLVPNLDTTNLTVDPALAVVGGSSKDADEAQPTRRNIAKGATDPRDEFYLPK